jgi:hypothetical protein
MSEAEARIWIGEILGVIRKGCLLSGTQIDENVVDMVQRAIENDMIWAWIWRVIGTLLTEEDGPILVEADADVAACEAAAVNPLLILAVIKALIDLWKSFRS